MTIEELKESVPVLENSLKHITRELKHKTRLLNKLRKECDSLEASKLILETTIRIVK